MGVTPGLMLSLIPTQAVPASRSCQSHSHAGHSCLQVFQQNGGGEGLGALDYTSDVKGRLDSFVFVWQLYRLPGAQSSRRL